MADSTAMTVDFLRARLLSERSVSGAAKKRADELAKTIADLEEQVRAVTEQRRQAERAAAEVLAILESQGFGGNLSDDSGSDQDDGEEEGDAKSSSDKARAPGGEEPAAAMGEAEDALSGTAQPGRLSWKGRSVSPRKATQLKHKHRRSYFYLLSSTDSSPKYRMGQSCRRNKRQIELSIGSRSAAPEGNGGVAGSQKRRQDGSDYTDDGQADTDGEVGGDERSSADGGGGQYVIRYETDGGMERVLERQAELIGQYEEEEKAQREWEKQYNENRNATKVDVEVKKAYHYQTAAVAKSSEKHLPSTINPSAECLPNGSLSESPQNASQEKGAIKAPSDGSPSGDTPNSKVSDWSSSQFHDNTDSQADAQPYRPASSNIADIEGVLQALQRARISLSAKLSKPVPPSQVTLALPAPGDEHKEYDDSSNSCREEELSSSSPNRQEILALPAPEDYHDTVDSPVDDTGIWVAKKLSSSSPGREEILALPGPGDDRRREIEEYTNIPVGAPGLFRLPTDSFPVDEKMFTGSISFGAPVTRHATGVVGHPAAAHGAATSAPSVSGDGSGFPAKQCYDLQAPAFLSVPAPGRCNVPAPDFTVGTADLFMQRGIAHTISNKWML